VARSSTSSSSSGSTSVSVDELGLVDALAQLSFVIQRILGRYAAENDVSMVQVRLFGILRDREPTMQDLARLLHLDKSSVTGLVQRAERRGFIEREQSADDRRVTRVTLTRTGRLLVVSVERDFAADIRSITANLDASDRQHLTELANRVVATQVAQQGSL
jgi:DNA-binding MarR family transcriptional regulator